MSEPRYDAVVLAGGGSRRMGGTDKTSLLVGGVPLLERALAAVAGAAEIVVVGLPRPVAVAVRWAREEPPGAGPAAALAAGLRGLTAPIVIALAGDLPFVTAGVVARLVSAAQPSGAVIADAGGAPQWLLGAWPRSLLQDALAGDQEGRSLRASLAPLRPQLLAPEETAPEWFDCDEPADLQAAKELLDGRAGHLAG
ncbi:MAG: Molybdopterin-guanine dinucleotide biosynthesis protein A-like protein [Mycobacterium sp.]|jgi:molybdopterin-guanine dinucleotide biosynthesis protein A|nr:Molybdopterin-guanine dinucleotide biosynthesis protein A-like protein [Mycobacterium sp.]